MQGKHFPEGIDCMEHLPGDPAFGVIESLIHHRLPRDHADQWFRMAGGVHLYTASGIHLLALLAWLERGARVIGVRTRIRADWIEGAVWLAFAGISLLVWKLEGFHFSLFRPLTSILIRRWMRLAGRKADVFLPFGMVLMLEALFAGFQGWSPGAWHYYLAVGGALVALARKSPPTESAFRLHLRMATYSWIPLAAWDMVHDRLSAPMTPLLSLVTIPVVAFVLYPLSLVSMAWTGGVHPAVEGAWGLFFKALVGMLDPFPVCWRVSGISIVAGVFFAALFFRYRRDPRIAVIFPLAWVLRLVLQSEVSQRPDHRVVQLDVGQGDSALIQKSEINELIDTGGGRTLGPDRWLRIGARYGWKQPLGVLLTHLDEDHAGGLRALLATTPVSCIEIGRPHLSTVKGAALSRMLSEQFPLTEIRESGCIRLSKVGWFESRRPGAAGNRWMAGVLHWISQGRGRGRGYLALGDGDAEQELRFLKHFERDIRRMERRVWKVGHHGSRFSSSEKFLRHLKPEESWISVGRRNRYGHPAPEVMARLAGVGGVIRRTDQEGDLVSTE